MKNISANYPRAFLIALAMIVVFELGNALFDDHFYTRETKTSRAARDGLDGFRMKIKNGFARQPDHRFDILIFGDSYALSGIRPDLLKSQTGLSAFNFGSFGDHGVFAAYCFLKNYLKSSSSPKYILIGFQPDTLSRRKLHPAYMYDLKAGNAWELVQEHGWAEGLKLQIPSLKHQHFYKGMVKGFKMPGLLSGQEISGFRSQVLRDQGFYAPHADLAVAEPVGEEDYNKKYRFGVSASSQRYLDRILDMARKRGIQVLYVTPTFSQDWYRLYAKYGVIAGYDQFLANFKARHPGLTILDFQPSLNEMGLYSDRLHLNIRGSHKLTTLISAKLKK